MDSPTEKSEKEQVEGRSKAWREGIKECRGRKHFKVKRESERLMSHLCDFIPKNHL